MFECTKPCANCPYRTDAPLEHWHREEFIKVIESEKSYMGEVFSCHKQNGSVCVGWIMKQDELFFPSLKLRIELINHNVTREYLDKLSSTAPLYNTTEDMIRANFPELLKT